MDRAVEEIIQEFEKRKVLVGREFAAMPNFLRVTIGTEEEIYQHPTHPYTQALLSAVPVMVMLLGLVAEASV